MLTYFVLPFLISSLLKGRIRTTTFTDSLDIQYQNSKFRRFSVKIKNENIIKRFNVIMEDYNYYIQKILGLVNLMYCMYVLTYVAIDNQNLL